MTPPRTVHRKFHFTHQRKGHKELVPGEAPPPVKPPRPKALLFAFVTVAGERSVAALS